MVGIDERDCAAMHPIARSAIVQSVECASRNKRLPNPRVFGQLSLTIAVCKFGAVEVYQT